MLSGEFGGLPTWAATGTDLPLEGESSVRMRSWEDDDFYDSDRFAADLETVGMDPDDVDHGVEILESIEDETATAVKEFWDAHPLRYIDAPDHLLAEAGRVRRFTRDNGLTRLRNWLAGRRIVVASRELVELRLQLFVLTAHPTPGCVSTYKTTTDQSRKLRWSITICGTGLSSEATVSTSVSSTLTALAGQAVLVFLPVTVAVEQVRVVGRDGTTLGSGQRIDVSPIEEQRPVPGGRLLDAGGLPAPGSPVQTYLLAGYPTGSTAEYGYEYKQERAAQLDIAVKVAGADLGVTGAVSMSTSVALNFTLVGGRDYRLCRLATGDGLVWA